MSYPYTFKIGTTDYSGYLTKYGYATTLEPVYADSMVDLAGVEHTAVLRYKGTLTVTLRPLEGTSWATLASSLMGGILEITYTCLQRNSTIIASMRLDTVSTEFVLENATRKLVGNTVLTFTQL